jgi:hypothetical protein
MIQQSSRRRESAERVSRNRKSKEKITQACCGSWVRTCQAMQVNAQRKEIYTTGSLSLLKAQSSFTQFLKPCHCYHSIWSPATVANQRIKGSDKCSPAPRQACQGPFCCAGKARESTPKFSATRTAIFGLTGAWRVRESRWCAPSPAFIPLVFSQLKKV